MTAERFPLIYSNSQLGDGYDGYPDNAEGLSGQSFPLNGFTHGIINDNDQNGRTLDYDNDDKRLPTDYDETWTINGEEKVLWEIAKYNESKIYYTDGREVIIDATVLLFKDGTFAITSKFDNIESADHVYEVHPDQIDFSKGVVLGTQVGDEIDYIDEFRRYRAFFSCFTGGTLIEALHGSIPIETLNAGDAVRTLDNGYQQIRWIGSKVISNTTLARHPELIPVRIKANALGYGLPERDLIVSRQHRVLVRSSIAQRMFGAMEVLIPAVKLINHDGIDFADDIQNITYWHILFDDHQVIFSEGTPTESLFIGPMALKSVSPEARREIQALFPQLLGSDFIPQPARYIADNTATVRQLVMRHLKNGKPLLC